MIVQKMFHPTQVWESIRGLQLWLVICLVLVLLALSRFVYEWLFPQILWLGQLWLVIPLAVSMAVLGCWLVRRQWLQDHAELLWPLLLNVIPLLPADVDLVRSGFLLGASLWLVGILWWRDRPWRLAVWLALGLAPVYLLTMSRTVGAADTFEFQVTAPIMGVVHPTGYPLYLILGKLWTLLPIGSVAWRLNVGTAVYGVGAAVGLFALMRLLLLHEGSAMANTAGVMTAVILALRPTFWSQAIAAEVYTLHNLFVALALILIIYPMVVVQISPNHYVYLAALLGLGLTNHLTTIILLPAAVLSYIFALTQSKIQNPKSKIPKTISAFFLPLILYAYLPLRWQAVNHEPMGWARFISWVTGDQFQDALQLMAWWRDPTRYEVVGRLFVAEWGWWLALAAVGLVYVWGRTWRIGLLLSLVWMGFVFYGLNYYVPDLSVFLLPAHLVTAVWIGLGIAVGAQFAGTRLKAHIPMVILGLVLVAAVTIWPRVDQSQNDGLTTWGMGVLSQPLAQNAVILADSEKIAPLLYLQRAEGWRPDLEIKVLPDEAAYRAELTTQLEAGRVVYLGRFVPGLEDAYHLRSAGPLTEVSAIPLTTMPQVDITKGELNFDEVVLLGTQIEPQAAIDPQQTAVTFYWQAVRPPEGLSHVYVRWAGEKAVVPNGQHPANNYYPTVAWEIGEIVPDFHLLPHPYPPRPSAELQVALAPPFTPASELPWQTVAIVDRAEFATEPQTDQVVRIAGDGFYLSGVAFANQTRPQSGAVLVTAVGEGIDQLQFGLLEPDMWGGVALTTELPAGTYTAAVRPQRGTLSCGWGQRERPFCPLGMLEIRGIPIPEGATNYGDKIALLDVAVPETELRPGGIFNVNLQWQALAPIDEDYTVFVQLLNEQDQIVGQVDAWPLQGTYPTSAWQVGELINDPYAVQLAPELPAGNYRLIVGLYRLADFQRLPVLDAEGAPFDDKYVLSGLVVQP